ncbi:MAG: tetraacyldisaccharide 4'-kinase, partial [Prevotella sp.]|nr:tetraacyldisaccharide 4'-kinase [Prevotella sp.]
VEYLIRLLKNRMKVAVLSRGYKRKSRGYVLAGPETTISEIGDEPYQMKNKFPDVFVAVDKDRCEGIRNLTTDETTKETDVILLDDAFQHRRVKPGINILLIDYHRLIIYDKLLPAGRLREPQNGKNRADIVIITKCPTDLKPMEFRVLTKAMNLFPYQDLFFSTLEYGGPEPIFDAPVMQTADLRDQNVLLLTGIASPKQMEMDLKPLCKTITPVTYGDHHRFKAKDLENIRQCFESMPAPKAIITTEKDAARITALDNMDEAVRKSIYSLPIKIKFMLGQEEEFNHKIISYVRKNSRNSILVKNKDDNKTRNSDHTGNRSWTISFRDN